MVLVVNQDFSPISVCSVQRAFLLLFLEKADLLEELEGQSLRTVSSSFPFPSVVKIKRYVNIPYRGVVMSRQNIFKRDCGKCQYCGTTKELTLDHVVPRSKGGKSVWTNLVTACKKCNSLKGDHSLEKIGMRLENKPIKPSYATFLRMNKKYQKEWAPYLTSKKVIK